MPNYRVIEAFELEGVPQEVDSIIELTEEAASDLLTVGKIELVPADE